MSDTKICTKCKQSLPREQFSCRASSKDGLGSYCRECDRQRARERYLANKEGYNLSAQQYYEANKEKVRAYHKEYEAKHRQRISARATQRYQQRADWVKDRNRANAQRRLDILRAQVFDALGGACYCCGLDDHRFLTIDHVQNDGLKDRSRFGFKMNGRTFYAYMLAQGCPRDRYQLACYNCNMARAHAGKGRTCPHQEAVA